MLKFNEVGKRITDTMIKPLIIIVTMLSLIFQSCSQHTNLNEPSDEIEQRVQHLLNEMTLEEKIGQMVQIGPRGYGSEDNLKAAIRQGRIGSILNITGVETINEMQRIAVEESRLGIPLIIGRDVIHGFRTIFPIPLGMAASWNEDLIRESAAIAAREAASSGINWTFAPMIDVSRDPRWGRIAESAGEDPLLNGMIARAMVHGFQGSDLSDPMTIAACAKHFIGYGAAEGGRDYNTTVISDLDLHNVYLPPFKEAIDAGVATVMTAFNEVNGIPQSGDKRNLRGILKEKWGFDGFVVSDWASIDEMIIHGFAENGKHAAHLAVESGVDMEMSSHTYTRNLKILIEEGKIKPEWIDDAVARILRIKLRLGLFDRPFTDLALADSVILHPNHLIVAQKLAEESVVLLKNANNVLPLKKGIRVALIGPLANQPHEQLGTWIFDGRASDSQTVLNAFNQLNGQSNTFFAEGLGYSRDHSTKGFAAVERAIASAEVVVAVVGEESILSGEAKSLAELRFPGKQAELLQLAASKGKPVVMVVMAGRPTGLNYTQHLADAILYAWHPGTMAGPALANLIFGESIPSGKLPVTFPKGEGQIPVYYAHKMSGRPASPQNWVHIDDIPVMAGQHSTGNTNNTLDYGFTPLYPFGYGLSYTTFEYSDIALSSERLLANEEISVSAVISNTGRLAAIEIVQLYVRDVTASFTRPVRELKAYQRISLEPGESKRVEFKLRPEQLGYYFPDGTFVTEPGDFHVWIAPDSAGGLRSEFVFE